MIWHKHFTKTFSTQHSFIHDNLKPNSMGKLEKLDLVFHFMLCVYLNIQIISLIFS